MSKHYIEINISNQSEGKHDYTFSVTGQEIEIENYLGEIKIEISLNRVTNRFFVSGKIKAIRLNECDRCLIDFKTNVECEFNLCLVLEQVNSRHLRQKQQGIDDEDNDQYRYIPPETNMIAFDDDVVETLLINEPLKKLCKEDCKGLCQTCGGDLNMQACSCSELPTDPRWQKLAALKKS